MDLRTSDANGAISKQRILIDRLKQSNRLQDPQTQMERSGEPKNLSVPTFVQPGTNEASIDSVVVEIKEGQNTASPSPTSVISNDAGLEFQQLQKNQQPQSEFLTSKTLKYKIERQMLNRLL